MNGTIQCIEHTHTHVKCPSVKERTKEACKRMDDQNGRNQLENADREVIKTSELDKNTAVGDLIEH